LNPETRSYSTQQLHEFIHKGFVDLYPPYRQNDEAGWADHQQITLIDSIFRNYHVPPIVFAIQVDDDGEEVRVCVDGKQRLASIQKFLDGQIPYIDVTTGNVFWYTTEPDSTRKIIPEDNKQDFASKKITCVEYRGLTPRTEQDLFERLKLGTTIAPPDEDDVIDSEVPSDADEPQ